jgi:hypothetical protein
LFHLGRSAICPILAATSNLDQRYFFIVLALDGDSTITKISFVISIDCFFLGGMMIVKVKLESMMEIISASAREEEIYPTRINLK